MSPLEKNLFRSSAHFSFGLFGGFFLLLSSINCLYILFLFTFKFSKHTGKQSCRSVNTPHFPFKQNIDLRMFHLFLPLLTYYIPIKFFLFCFFFTLCCFFLKHLYWEIIHPLKVYISGVFSAFTELHDNQQNQLWNTFMTSKRNLIPMSSHISFSSNPPSPKPSLICFLHP